MKEQHIVIISPFYNCKDYIERCIDSVASQNYKNYLQFLIDDCSTDNSLDIVNRKINSLSDTIKSKFLLISNEKNFGAVYNQINTLKHELITNDSIVILLDGDDALYTNPEIFNFYNNLYDGSTEFTYGSCWSEADNIPLIAQEYPPEVKENKWYKQYKFNWNIPYTHLRTFKKYLVNNISDSVFKDTSGKWFRAGGDNATFYNVIKQANPNKVKTVSDIVCFYNDINPLNDYKINSQEQTKNVELILNQQPTIEVFYHIFIPNNEHALYSFWWIDEQLKLIINSELNTFAKINVAITMPSLIKKYKLFQFLPNGINPGSIENSEYTFEDKIKEYFDLKYPFVNILGIRNTEDENLYEQYILNFIYESAQQNENKKILYIHTKGTILFTPYQKDWLDILNHIHITKWKECIEYLDIYEVVGIKDKNHVNVMSGNFWWATGKYIKSLCHPRNVDQYSNVEGRYAYEYWITSNTPKIYYILNTHIDHYKNYYLQNKKINEQFTIVIPTMWRYNNFCPFLNELVISDYVKEIIIIDNSELDRPEHGILFHPKITIKSFGENIFVNPAWNYGVDQSSTNKICIVNDDIEFDTKLFEKIDIYYEQDFGVIGLCPGELDFNQPSITTGEIEILPWNNEHTYGFGCLMFINKLNWTPIPNELKVYFGDNFIFDHALFKGKINYLITNMKFTSPFATTTSDTSIVEGKLDKEHNIYMNIIKSNFITINPIINLLNDCQKITEINPNDGTYTEMFLNKKDVSLRVYNKLRNPIIDNLLKNAYEQAKDVYYWIGDVNICEIEPTDILFINTFDNINQLRDLLTRHGKKVSKYIVIKDNNSHLVSNLSSNGWELVPQTNTNSLTIFKRIKEDIKTILIAIPTAKYIEPETFKSIYDLKIPNGYNVQFQYFYGYNIAQIRNLIADWVIKGFDYLFAVDSDITFSSDTLIKLLSHDKDVVSGLYIQRIPDKHELELYDKTGRIKYEDIENKGLIEVFCCGFGCVLVKKEVFIKVGYPQFEYHSAIDHKDTISEDTDFCKKAIIKGFKIWADTSIKCNHLGDCVYSIEDKKKEMIQERLIELGNQPLLPLPHINYLHHMKDNLKIEPNVIYDIGACVLHWTKETQKVWPNSTYVVFEAMQETKFLYEQNNLLHYNGVLSNYDGKLVEFYKNVTHPGGNSYYRENIEVNPEAEIYFPDDSSEIVITKTLDTIVKENNFPLPNLIKMDVQGAELDIIQGAKETLKHCKHLILELQNVEYNKGAPSEIVVISYLNTIGFELTSSDAFCNSGSDGDYHFINTNLI